MAGRDLAEAAERIKKRKELLKQAVPMKPDAPENIHLSRDQFIAKRIKEKEEDLAIEKYRQEYRAKKENKDGVREEKKEEKVEEPKKKGRPKRVE